jgi:hypothetical protein
LDGLLFNIDRSLEHRLNAARKQSDSIAIQQLLQMMAFVRVTANSYHALRYLIADDPPDPKRKPTFVLAIPPINRQLMDLLFTLVYMFDEFGPRSLAYRRATWRELNDESHRFSTTFRNNPEWKLYFKTVREAKQILISALGITSAEQKNPKIIDYWKHPKELSEQKTASRPFLRWLFSWLYLDTSAQAHLSAGGLFVTAPFILANLLEDSKAMSDRREYQSYRFHQFSRAILLVLAIGTEIDAYFTLGCRSDAAYLWGIVQAFIPEGKDMYYQRYDALLKSQSLRAKKGT